MPDDVESPLTELPTKSRPDTLAVDFDGVIHQYSRGWQDGTIYDPPMPGALDALRTLMATYAVFIHTTRNATDVATWLSEYGFDTVLDIDGAKQPKREFWNEQGALLVTDRKLPAVAYLDDRAVRFHDWGQALTALGVTPRLLDCGLCYEEWGEEVHPHPDCVQGGALAQSKGGAQ